MNYSSALVRATLRLIVALIVAYVTYSSLLGIAGFLPRRVSSLPYMSPITYLVASILVFIVAYLKPWGHVFIIPVTLLASLYLFATPTPSRIVVDLALLFTGLLASSISELVEAGGRRAARLRFNCGFKCTMFTVASQVGVYALVLFFSYYFGLLFRSIYSIALQPRGFGLFYELWSLSARSLLVQGILFFTAIGLAYVTASRIIAPLLYAASAPRDLLLRVYYEYLDRERESVLRAKKWYHVVLAQSIGFATAFPAAIIGYGVSLAIPDIVGRLPLPGREGRMLLEVVVVLVLSTLVYYASKKAFLYLIAGRPNWRLLSYIGAVLVIALVVAVAVYPPLGGLQHMAGSLLGWNTTRIDYIASRIDRGIANSFEASEKLLETVAKILWG